MYTVKVVYNEIVFPCLAVWGWEQSHIQPIGVNSRMECRAPKFFRILDGSRWKQFLNHPTQDRYTGSRVVLWWPHHYYYINNPTIANLPHSDFDKGDLLRAEIVSKSAYIHI